MIRRMTSGLASGMLVLAVAACAPSAYFTGQSKQGAGPLLESDTFEAIDLALLLSPSVEACPDSAQALADPRARLANAFNSFYEPCSELNKDSDRDNELQLRRNRVQDRLVAASNQRCALYKQHVRRFDSTSNVLLGALTTLSAGAGALVTHVDSARMLSGLAAAASGVRAELNETYFQKNTIQVLSSAFEERRNKLRAEMLERNGKSIHAYTVERAVADALRYHDACSLVAGLEEVALQQGRGDDIGLKRLMDLLKQLSGSNNSEKTGDEQTGDEQTGGDQTGGDQTGGDQTGGDQTGGEQI